MINVRFIRGLFHRGCPRGIGACAIVMAWASLAFADSKTSPPELPPADAMTLLETHCVKCHGGEKTKGGLNLLTRDALLRGGENGPVILPDKPDQSPLLQSIRHEIDPPMPHKEKKLSDAAIAQFASWVKAGAPYTRALTKGTTDASSRPVVFTVSDADRAHWAFQPVKRPSPPSIANSQSSIHNPIDAFILAKLQSNGLKFSPPANRQTLIRRVTFDLIGLPPTAAEIDAFVNDNTSDAYAKLIDRLLASPHYGERWGRHWLDLARYAETDGFEYDGVRPNSWRYRDYVIRSFNADKPYDRFIREQIAGDELWPQDADAQIATGFNLLGPDMVDSADQQQRHHNTLNDMTDTTALTFLGLTMGCAKCHDHKFEPISQRDYYSMQAFFAPAAFVREKPIPSDGDAAREAAQRIFDQQPAVRELAELEAPLRDKLRNQKLARLSHEAQAAHNTPAGQRTTEQANFVLETEGMLQISEKELTDAFDTLSKAHRKELLEAIKKLAKPSAPPMAMALADGKGPPSKTFVLFRGEYAQPGDEVEPRFPTVLTSVQSSASPVTALRRAALANWIASPDNPLTARVMVNRIWQHHFGRPLVVTPSDFGTHGQKPTHPELLDWLASEFISHAWSIKQMHKLILMSATYQQSSLAIGDAERIDPENHFYSHMNRLRLEGEVIRDSILAIGGQLNLQMGGPGVYPPIPQDLFKGSTGWVVSKGSRDHVRRSIYIFARRNLRFPFLEVFDAPDNNLSCPSRERSTTAPQALTLLNADEVTTAARATATRLTSEAASQDERITLAYRLTLGREPTEKERALMRAFLVRSPLNEFCRALFNLNDFVYVE